MVAKRLRSMVVEHTAVGIAPHFVSMGSLSQAMAQIVAQLAAQYCTELENRYNCFAE